MYILLIQQYMTLFKYLIYSLKTQMVVTLLFFKQHWNVLYMCESNENIILKCDLCPLKLYM